MNFSSLTFDRLLADSKTIEFENKDRLYINAYPHLLKFFSQKKELNESDFIQGVHMVYAWMPTTLKKLDLSELGFILGSLDALKMDGTYLHEGQLKALKKCVNNSIVGSSKLLHFINPEQYAIWDSKVVKYITGNSTSYGVDSVDNYLHFLDKLYEITSNKNFSIIQHEMNNKIGYEVSKLRAAEFVMFLTK